MIKNYYHTIHQIILTGHWITDQISKELKEFGITEPQYNVMRVLKEANGEPVSVQKILENMVQKSSNVTRIIDKLVTKGYTQRQECPTNRRKMDITLTDEGAKLLDKLDKKVYNFHQPMLNNLTSEELETLRNLIIKLKTIQND